MLLDSAGLPFPGITLARAIDIEVETEPDGVGPPFLTESGEVAGMLAMSGRDHSDAIGADALDKFLALVMKQ